MSINQLFSFFQLGIAARQAVPELEAQELELIAKLAEVRQKLSAAKSVIAAADSEARQMPQPAKAFANMDNISFSDHQSEAVHRISDIAETVASPSASIGVRAPRNRIYQHVHEVLKGGGMHSAASLQAELIKKFNIKYGISSVYRALTKGAAEGYYKNTNGEWYMDTPTDGSELV